MGPLKTMLPILVISMPTSTMTRPMKSIRPLSMSSMKCFAKSTKSRWILQTPWRDPKKTAGSLTSSLRCDDWSANPAPVNLVVGRHYPPRRMHTGIWKDLVWSTVTAAGLVVAISALGTYFLGFGPAVAAAASATWKVLRLSTSVPNWVLALLGVASIASVSVGIAPVVAVRASGR